MKGVKLKKRCSRFVTTVSPTEGRLLLEGRDRIEEKICGLLMETNKKGLSTYPIDIICNRFVLSAVRDIPPLLKCKPIHVNKIRWLTTGKSQIHGMSASYSGAHWCADSYPV